MEATFRAGTPLRNMSLALDEKGYAMIQLGSVAGQSIAGAISTGEIMDASFAISVLLFAFKLTCQSTLLHSCLTTTEFYSHRYSWDWNINWQYGHAGNKTKNSLWHWRCKDNYHTVYSSVAREYWHSKYIFH